jgi:hypothetical protein
MWTQIIGKIRLKLAPHVNHWWQVPLYVTSRGLTTSPMPYGGRTLDATFDFISHRLILDTDDGEIATIGLYPRSVADFYHEVMATLRKLGFDIRIWTHPSEVPNPIPFEQDTQHASYDGEYAHRFWRVLVEADTILKQFRGGFIGKASPVHFFWGGFDLAVTRFSGRRAPERPGADSITREGYSHEVSSCGFWTGTGSLTAPAFYSYAAPEPTAFKDAPVRPGTAFYSPEFSEFLLGYDDVRRADDPPRFVREFLQTTYNAAATLAHWDRQNLERTTPAV